jgi:hypothetical protein
MLDNTVHFDNTPIGGNSFLPVDKNTYITDGATLNGHINIMDNKTFVVEEDVNVKIGDFEIKADDLGRLLEKFAKEFMPEVLL